MRHPNLLRNGLIISWVAAPVLGCIPLTSSSLAAAARPTFSSLKQAVRRDPAPQQTTRGKHYINTDEERHDLFYQTLAGRGGMYIGVGSNQNYVLAAWAEAEALVVVDFDEVVIDLHRLFEVVFRNTESSRAFRAAWEPDHEVSTLTWLEKAYPAGATRRRLSKIFRKYRPNMRWGLNQFLRRTRKYNVSTYLNDPEQFAHLKELFDNNRVLLVRGDFTGDKTMMDIAKLARKAEMTIGALYLSNIEQYFTWDDGRYRENMLGLPLNDDSVVLRCFGIGSKYAADGRYKYFVQSGDLFRDWLRFPGVDSVRTMLATSIATGIRGFRKLSHSPEEALGQAQSQREPERREQEAGRGG
jgi:hypothetical protein